MTVTAKDLSALPLFEGFSEEHLAPLAEIASEVSCREGDSLFREGGVATRLFILLDGKIRIQVKLTSRPENVTVASLSEAGQLIGWSGSVRHANHYTASALAQTDCRMIAFEGDRFMDILDKDREMGFVVMRRMTEVVSGRLRNIQRVVLKTM